MRKKLVVFVAFLLVLNLCSALSTDMKPTYAAGETMIVKLSGNIVDPLSVRQVSFLRAGNVQEIPMIYDLKKLEDTYYLWALAPKIANNYTLALRDIVTTVSGSPTKFEYRQNFSVTGNLTEYSISPGFIIAEKRFEIHIQLYRDEPLTISSDFPQRREYRLQPGDNLIEFLFENIASPQTRMINLGSYLVPVQFTASAPSVISESGLSFSPSSLARTLPAKEKNKSVSFKLMNTGKEDLTNILITYPSERFSLVPDGKVSLKAGESKTFTLILTASDGIRVQEQLSARAGEQTIVLPIKIDFVENVSINVSVNGSELYRCSELGGSLCASTQRCTGTLNASQEGNCCVGTCVEQQADTGDGNSFWGYLIAILLLLGLGYLYWKYKKTKADTNPLPKKIKEAEHVP